MYVHSLFVVVVTSCATRSESRPKFALPQPTILVGLRSRHQATAHNNYFNLILSSTHHSSFPKSTQHPSLPKSTPQPSITMKSTITLALLALATSSTAQIPTVTLVTTDCLNTKSDPKEFSIAINAVGVTNIDAPSICGLALKSSSPTIPLDTITCQAFKNGDQTPASAPFTSQKPASISTNPVSVTGVWCRTPEFGGSSGVLTSIVSLSLRASASVAAPSASLTAIVPGVTLGTPIGVTQTATARLGVPTGNATGSGNGTGTSVGEYTGEAAGRVGRWLSFGAGVAVAGVMGLVL
ncbi:hypothetical protein EK21DRAFT_84212 [Setomelanomma holmii]|uniref:Uncharacterized protein n=1 Tax=Setomelanomma holmii TaxID=210430 RepID=A0A9P4LQ55_9PLEO|nr:hypothetical protein EK21DRAFT_84212 [Setomelanomma holmii]